MKTTKKQALSIYKKAKKSMFNTDVYIIYLENDSDIINIVAENSIRTWKEKNGAKYVLTKEFVNLMFELSGLKLKATNINTGYLYTGLGLK